MIPFNFEYYRPDTIAEACTAHKSLTDAGKNPIYFAGGTEILTFSRDGQLEYQAVIDLKSVPECNIFDEQNNQIIIGANTTLTQIGEVNIFPFLTETARLVADHTSRNQITIGGNVMSVLPFKEVLLALLVCDADVLIAGCQGTRTASLMEIFNQKISLRKEEFVVQFLIDSSYKGLSYKVLKKTKQSKLEYPLATVASIKKDGKLRFAFSGLCSCPFRTKEVEDILNNQSLTMDDKIAETLIHLPYNLVDDLQGSAEYRQFVLKNVLKDILTSLEGAV